MAIGEGSSFVARSGVDRISNHRVLEPRFRSDVPHYCVPAVNPDTVPERRETETRHLFVQSLQPLMARPVFNALSQGLWSATSSPNTAMVASPMNLSNTP